MRKTKLSFTYKDVMFSADFSFKGDTGIGHRLLIGPVSITEAMFSLSREGFVLNVLTHTFCYAVEGFVGCL